MPKFKVGDKVILRYIPSDRVDLMGDGKDYGISADQFGTTFTISRLMSEDHRGQQRYIIKPEGWSVLEIMLLNAWAMPKDPVYWRVQVGSWSTVRPFERAATLAAIYEELGLDQPNVIKRSANFVSGLNRKDSFTLMRMD